MFVYYIFMISPRWLADPHFLRRIIYLFLYMCHFDWTVFAVGGKVGTRKPV